jgi:hypothetical protein
MKPLRQRYGIYSTFYKFSKKGKHYFITENGIAQGGLDKYKNEFAERYLSDSPSLLEIFQS